MGEIREREWTPEEARDALARMQAEMACLIAQASEQTRRLEEQKAELKAANSRLEALATRDGLTGLTNHRTFHERLHDEVERAHRYNAPLAVVLLDIDHFKMYNDAFGHPAGDAVLRRAAEALTATARATDVVARYGGEEFAVILIGTSAESAKLAAERFRASIAAIRGLERAVTASFGVANLSTAAPDAVALVSQADAALYRSKRRGRNCVTCFTDPFSLSELPEGPESCTAEPFQQALVFQIDTVTATARTVEARLTRSYDATVESWSRVLDIQEKEPEGHGKRVTGLTVRLARAAGIDEEQVLYAKWGALLHDIGTMGVPDAILRKPGPLSEEEWSVIRRHPAMAHEMLSPILFLGPALDIPRYHHERWDGAGYPYGLKGEQIPLATRLFAVADVYDSLRTDRPYRKAWPEARVRRHIRNQAGTHFDPRAVRTLLKLLGDSDSARLAADRVA